MVPKTRELRGMSDEQLLTTLRDLEKHLFTLRVQAATDRLKAPAEVRKTKRAIARVKTIQRQRELEKLRQLPPDQLQARIERLEKRVEEDQPGKRRAFRQAQRLKRFLAEKMAAPKT
ncbi:MAG: 50S ribosomal protein L29 [Thermogemmata sp.]|jgi:large subunit ribosomal protein L29|uniref:Large ribosomal subunit protein uL29 n=1 Tax=Thermogemmata fonticola TaxID=2755323 RepID=A0A7V8VDG5_9BACT|nr:50S ribosomal protein L29 [Thermogemmata fonticola]MBA2225717.1 50S ribosomal protein L29 [Thermogemmata fonticola]MCX8138240.1 50S ribosomal protein L29 [Gemmataceae bacterium]